MPRHVAVVVALAVLLASGCATSAPVREVLLDARSCSSLVDELTGLVERTAAMAARAPVDDVFSVGRRRPEPVAELHEAVIAATIRAEQIGCLEQLRTRLSRAMEHLQDEHDATPAVLLLEQMDSDRDRLLDALRRALVLAAELQRSFHHRFGTYAIDLGELRAQAPYAIAQYAPEASFRVLRAGLRRYCMEVSVPGLPVLYVEGPGRDVTGEPCVRP